MARFFSTWSVSHRRAVGSSNLDHSRIIDDIIGIFFLKISKIFFDFYYRENDGFHYNMITFQEWKAWRFYLLIPYRWCHRWCASGPGFWTAHSPPMRHRPSRKKSCHFIMNISEDQLYEDKSEKWWSRPLSPMLSFYLYCGKLMLRV